MLKKKILPIILGAGIILSFGVNVYLYSESSSINQGATGIQTELKNIQNKNEELSLKIKDGKEKLSTIQ